MVQQDFVLFPSLRIALTGSSVVQAFFHFTIHNMRIVIGNVFVVFVLLVDGVVPLGVVEVIVDPIVAVVQVLGDSRVGRQQSNLEENVSLDPPSPGYLGTNWEPPSRWYRRQTAQSPA